MVRTKRTSSKAPAKKVVAKGPKTPKKQPKAAKSAPVVIPAKAPKESYSSPVAFVHRDNRKFKTRKEKIAIDFAQAGDIMKRTNGPAPSLPSASLVSAICALVRHGHNILPSAVALGVPKHTFEDWWVKGLNQPDSDYGLMIQAIEAAEAQGEILDIEKINNDPRATNLMWKRARRSRSRWGGQAESQTQGIELPTIKHEHTVKMDLDESAQMLGMLEVMGYLNQALGETPAPQVALPAPVEPIDTAALAEKLDAVLQPEKKEESLAEKYV